ncbi:hypothetical protein S83_016110 [Arachis hypogaea]
MRSSSIEKKEHIGIHDALVIRSLESPIEMSLVGNRDRDDKRYWSLDRASKTYRGRNCTHKLPQPNLLFQSHYSSSPSPSSSSLTNTNFSGI